MRNIHVSLPPELKDRIKQTMIAGGLYKMARKALGKGALGLALPAVALLIDDLSRPDGVVLPFLRWLMSRRGKIKIIEMSAKPLKKTDKKKIGDAG